MRARHRTGFGGASMIRNTSHRSDSSDGEPAGLGDMYAPAFYQQRSEGSYRSAVLITEYLLSLYRPRSAIDLGCGAGGWLHALEEHGVADLLGVDGKHVLQRDMEIEPSRFRPHDLREPFSIDRRFDLAISTEVAEHLPETSATSFVESLTRLAPVVLFSAAIPGQPGINHINCQWPSYWADIFRRFGFDAYDCIRPVVWDDERIDWWYRQNLVLYANDGALFSEPLRPHAPAARVQLDSYLAALNDFRADEQNRRDLRTITMRELVSMMPSRAALWLKHRVSFRSGKQGSS
jgi:hypothetical protein